MSGLVRSEKQQMGRGERAINDSSKSSEMKSYLIDRMGEPQYRSMIAKLGRPADQTCLSAFVPLVANPMWSSS